jgi:hypothetical protein
MITEPLPLPATAVLKPIAPTRTSIAATTVSFFDIVPPRNTTTREVLYMFRHQCQEVRRADLCFFVEKCPKPGQRGLNPAERSRITVDTRIVEAGDAFHNSTVVLKLGV